MVITWATSVEELLILDNVNNYFRAVLFRMIPKHIKSYSFLSSFFLIQVYILVVTAPFPCRKARLRVLQTTLALPVSD